MKKLFTFMVAVFLTATLWAQSPEKMSYQAVIRNSSEALVTNTTVGMQISILQGSASGTAVYVETQTPTSNANGLVSVEIGSGTVVSGTFATIDWSNGPYFIKTETDPTGGTSYTITGTSQLLSVPYALHAKTAESVTGTITETDPVFGASVASGITGTDTTYWNNKLDSYNETDPVFGASVASGITGTDTTYWNNKLDSYNETDPVFSAWDKTTGISITESQISDLGNYIETETDPAVAANFDFTDAANGDLLQFNGTKWVKVTPTYISDYTVTESDVTSHQAALSITESQISDLGNYIETETDPAVAANFDFTDAANGDLLQFNGTKWVKVTPTYISDYTVTESDVTSHQAALSITESQISDLGNYIETETDPSVPIGTQIGEMQYWNGTAWVTVAATENEGATLQMIGGIPTWVGGTPPTPNVTNPTTGEIWMDRNLGASQVATSSTDAAAYGDLYQWGRAADGHESRTSGTTSTLATSDTPGHGNFITNGSSPYDWRNPQNDNLWQGVSGTNNPCPSGYRLPTEAEWEAERTSWSSNNEAGAFASPLKLPVAGIRNYSDGTLINVGSSGYYWSSTVNGAYARNLVFFSSNAFMSSDYRAFGFSVRCLKD